MGLNLSEESDLNRACFSKEKCVFISHKKEDENAAIAIGKYLTDVAKINIYLDIKDCVLQEAVSTNNDEKIVNSIHTGLALSSHLLCLISEKTRLSWWVPYEIGYAEKSGIEIASLQLKSVDDVPSYLKTQKVLVNTDDFIKHISTIDHYGSVFYKLKYPILSSSDKSLLVDYIR